MTRIYFVRHAQPDHNYADRIRPLTEEGQQDTKMVLDFFKEKNVDQFYCSPYKRSYNTIASTAQFFGKEIITDERLRERESGIDANNLEMFRKRWDDFRYHEEGGESLGMVQERNMSALWDILATNEDKTLVIGTHGTALSTILNYFDPAYNCDSFLRMINWMPYIIEVDFEGKQCVGKREHTYINKPYRNK
ncbi:histidine phosphatase family protein [Anaerosporobacter faecicola]|uniref:histidine phosphatase family protein n=1 Tax=Anaerosporobacter faecicola TaxID=2718714 RepID=UPI0014394B7F|nr:histidine phosphatase family protein [Anaerosporobacter faecicola]